MRWVTREHVRTERAKKRSVWHRWFAWHPVVVRVEKGFEQRVWFAPLERKWSFGRYGEQKGHWRYRHPLVRAERTDLAPEQTDSRYARDDDVARNGSEGRVSPDLGGHKNRSGESRLH
jgi:hypothetical protein